MDRGILARMVKEPALRWLVGLALFVTSLPAVMVFRAIVASPYRLPSAGNAPNLLVGDHVLADKTRYGLWVGLPFGGARTEWVDLGDPERGDLIVFRYPKNESFIYVQRVVGVPGDRLRVVDHRVFVDDKPLPTDDVGSFAYYDQDCQPHEARRLTEHGPTRSWDILIEPGPPGPLADHPRDGSALVVPEGHVFVMGDNRGNSEDSRAFGFVSFDQILGRADTLWFSFEACEQRPRTERFLRSVLPETP